MLEHSVQERLLGTFFPCRNIEGYQVCAPYILKLYTDVIIFYTTWQGCTIIPFVEGIFFQSWHTHKSATTDVRNTHISLVARYSGPACYAAIRLQGNSLNTLTKQAHEKDMLVGVRTWHQNWSHDNTIIRSTRHVWTTSELNIGIDFIASITWVVVVVVSNIFWMIVVYLRVGPKSHSVCAILLSLYTCNSFFIFYLLRIPTK